MSLVSSVSIATGYGLDFSVLHSDKTGSGDHSAFYPLGCNGSFPGGKQAGT
jgi:hypothetical protein